ncbi:T9SS type A sorting domain-containing protein, partial [Tenacibaculum agarivorans]|uniref:T9SS type A sorting domain-containing protein n=1 Tax=Tenacibaculum agarivorans TaxID=1908389 RepID=UPI000A79CED5
LSGNTLSLSNDATSVDLGKYLDNTDSQELDFSSNELSISGSSKTVDLSGYLDNTDAQILTISGNNLSIANGNSVDLSVFENSDSQDLASATLSGTVLTVAIENGRSVDVDLAPILSVQQTQINDLLSRVEQIEKCACSGTLSTGEVFSKNKQPILYQNIPNPFNNTTSIKYFVPQHNDKAAIVFSNTSGQVIDTVFLQEKGEQEIFFNSSSLPSGVYYYTLYVDSHKIDTKKMIIE